MTARRCATRSMRSGTCRCRRTSSVRTRSAIAIAIRPSTRASADRSRRRRPACTSRRRFSRRCARKGVERASITLHVGYGTFQPIRVESVDEHQMEAEHYEVSAAAAAALSKAKREGRRIIAVGTTTTRTLESLTVAPDGTVSPGSGETALFIHPGHDVQARLRPDHQFPSAEVVAPDAGVGVRGPRARSWRRIEKRWPTAIGSIVMATRCLFHERSSYEAALRRIRPRRHQDLSAALAAEQGEPRAVCDAAQGGLGHRRPHEVAARSAGGEGLQGCRRGDRRGEARGQGDHLGAGRARVEDRPVAGAGRSDGARLHFGDRDQRRRASFTISRSRCRAAHRKTSMRRLARARSAWPRRPARS